MNAANAPGTPLADRTARNTTNLALWTGAWVTSMALATFGPKYLWDGATALTAAAVLLNVVLGIGMIFANRRYLLGLDEMQQRIHLNAMAVTLGVTLVGGLAYATLDTVNLIAGDAEIAYLVVLMSITYLVSLIAGTRYYR